MRHIVQYTIVAIIILQALYWIWKKIFRASPKEAPDCQKGCLGCIIQDKCNKPQAMVMRKNSRK
ncbi:MAG: hypothetical protein K2K93_10660 [Muribaculaceae bacterium]|nr:hypothetical protein [Muribaculaceae bacterium]